MNRTMAPKNVTCKNFEHSKFDVLLTNIGHFECSKFLHVTFLGAIVLFIFCRCLRWKSFNMGCKLVNLKRHDWQINFSSIRRCSCFISTFLNNLFTDTWCRISRKVNHVSDQDSNVSEDSWFVNFILDLNWDVRMCCEVPLRLCVW